MSGLPEFRLSLNSLFCLSDGEGTGRFPSSRLSVELSCSAAGSTIKLGDKCSLPDLCRLLSSSQSAPAYRSPFVAQTRGIWLRLRGGLAPTSALHRWHRLGASRPRAAAAAAAAVATAAAEFTGPGGGRLPIRWLRCRPPRLFTFSPPWEGTW